LGEGATPCVCATGPNHCFHRSREIQRRDGRAERPVQIATAADLIALGETPEDYDKHFLLTADIDLDPNLPGRKVFDRAIVTPDTNDARWEFDGTPFTGVFDGNAHAISHLTIIGHDHVGLFGVLLGQVRSLGVVDVDVSASWDVGGLVGYVGHEVPRLVECYSTGAVRGNEEVGGLVLHYSSSEG
jgi:hypothetical protein